MHVNLLLFALGALLLIVGRKLFWLAVAVIGFASGLEWAPQFIHDDSKLIIFVVALAMGLVGAILEVFLQYLAVGIAGFIAGVHLTLALWNFLNLQSTSYLWLFSLIGGVILATVALSLLNWALIILSSLVGAGLVSQALMLHQSAAALVFVLLVVVGILMQSHLIRRPATVT